LVKSSVKTKMTQKEAEELLKRRRKQCIVHRILYYVYNNSIVPDHQYDKWERELRDMCEQYPALSRKIPYYQYCPSHVLGSSSRESYPEHLLEMADWLLEYHYKGERK
jgi:NAD-dependent DNA ligase